MRTYLLTMSKRSAGVGTGLVFGVCVAFIAASYAGSISWPAMAISGAVGGGLFGAMTALMVHRGRRGMQAAAGDLPAAHLPDAYRAAVGGPIPADPLVRAAAARVAQHLIQAVRESWIVTLAMMILMAVMAAFNVLFGNYLFAALATGTMLAHASELHQLKRLPRRVERLAA
ncbi:hypothetical protein ACIBL3_34075 [Kribbella sp. NPDC050124]|uniref:hypothetical protein n=1 Tax=Kribbella sp. NPDC050124 TaxID=3364114 RepID=UPI00379F8D99